jgi:hypothetical protein
VLEEDKLLEQLALRKNWKKCPFCNNLVEKNQGCDHMKCRCGKDFCYRCGGVYLKCECVKNGTMRLGLFGAVVLAPA